MVQRKLSFKDVKKLVPTVKILGAELLGIGMWTDKGGDTFEARGCKITRVDNSSVFMVVDGETIRVRPCEDNLEPVLWQLH